MKGRIFDRGIILRIFLLAGLALGGVSLPGGTAQAISCPSSVIVTNANDSGAGSLRQAISEVCTGGTISFDSSLAGQTITLASGELSIAKSLTLTGLADAPGVAVSGNDASRVFNITAGTVTISDLAIQNGLSTGGAGLNISGAGTAVTLQDCAVLNNSLTGLNSGGGILINEGSSLAMTNCTVSGNSSTFDAGGILNMGTLAINSSTITNNSANGGNNGGGGLENVGAASLRNTIIAGNNGHAYWGPDCYTPNSDIQSYGYNLIRTPGGACSIVSAANPGTDQNGVYPGSGPDPLLGALQNNGGPTSTHALLADSPAIDAIPGCNSAPATDQRGVTRPLDGYGIGTFNCDIGAYEYGAVTPAVTASDPAENATVSGPQSITVTFNTDVLNDGSLKAADNLANYLLIERGANGSFDTASCKAGPAADDVQQTLSSAVYSNNNGDGPYTATLTLAGALSAGHYRLFVCGTTSIWGALGLKLNNGAGDAQINFNVSAPATATPTAAPTATPAPTATAIPTATATPTKASQAGSLPQTGFAPGGMTKLPAQPAEKAYSATVLTLEIPALGVKAPIAGVPQSGDSWDVSWLGDDVGYLDGTAFPTWAGNTLLTGHVWNADDTPGVFVHLKDLKYGDQIKIHAFGQVYTYEVRESRTVWPSQTSVALQHEKLDWVTLLTCEDYHILWNDYSLRRMVRAVRVSVAQE